MREVKFRAWVKELGILANVIAIDFENEKVVLSIGVESTCWWYASTFDLKDVELMQYTGLKDKNGVEICEGDIIGREKDDTKSCVSHHVVEWHDTGFMSRQVCSYSSYIGLVVWTQHKDGYVVLGNLYKNPELLVNEGGA